MMLISLCNSLSPFLGSAIWFVSFNCESGNSELRDSRQSFHIKARADIVARLPGCPPCCSYHSNKLIILSSLFWFFLLEKINNNKIYFIVLLLGISAWHIAGDSV